MGKTIFKEQANAGVASFLGKGLLLAAGLIFSVNAFATEERLKGQAFYEKICLQCHEVGVGPELKGRGLPPEYFKLIVRSGFRAMPAFPQTHIDDETLNELAHYLSKAPASSPAVSAAK